MIESEDKENFEQLIEDALRHEFSGWDFSFIEQRWQMKPTSWNYRDNVLNHLGNVNSLLDMGTGGGEFLSSLTPLPPDTCATEDYPPNLPVARDRLTLLGVQVAETLPEDRLPFEDQRFDLVINRHEDFSVREICRVLGPKGRFITQQVGDRDNIKLNEHLQTDTELETGDWNMDFAVHQLEDAGFHIIECIEEFPETVVSDIGAVVFYLKAIPWQITGFTVEKYRDSLYDLHQMILSNGSLIIQSHRFYIEAIKS